jgi:hypothetical protein
MSYTSELQAVNARLGALTDRLNEIDSNVVHKMDELLDWIHSRSPADTNPPLPPVVKPEDPPVAALRDGLAEVVQAVSTMPLVGAMDRMMGLNYEGQTWRAVSYAIAINTKWPSEWRNVKAPNGGPHVGVGFMVPNLRDLNLIQD